MNFSWHYSYLLWYTILIQLLIHYSNIHIYFRCHATLNIKHWDRFYFFWILLKLLYIFFVLQNIYHFFFYYAMIKIHVSILTRTNYIELPTLFITLQDTFLSRVLYIELYCIEISVHKKEGAENIVGNEIINSAFRWDSKYRIP